ncbi:MAG: hypothetical protein LBQ12_03630 [Deltaproteobacteria bacterium]|nr:hypothetical protein [Deltaproteobacteria bacterium]
MDQDIAAYGSAVIPGASADSSACPDAVSGGGSHAESTDCAVLSVFAEKSCPATQAGLPFELVGSEPIPVKTDGNGTIFYPRVKQVFVSMPSIVVLVNYLDSGMENYLDGELLEFRLSGSALSPAGLAAVKPNAQALAPYVRGGRLHFAVACQGGPEAPGSGNGANSSVSLVPALSGGGFGAVETAYVGGSYAYRNFDFRDIAVSRDGTALILTGNNNAPRSAEYVVYKTTVANMHLRAESPARIELDSKNAPSLMSGTLDYPEFMDLPYVLELNGAPSEDFFTALYGAVFRIFNGIKMVFLSVQPGATRTPGQSGAAKATASAKPDDEVSGRWFAVDTVVLMDNRLTGIQGRLPYFYDSDEDGDSPEVAGDK